MLVYTLRLSDEERPDIELDRLTRFYTANRRPGNRVRDPIQLLRSITSRQAYILEDQEHDIVGVALCFDYGPHTESGGTQNGFRLQALLHICRSVNEHFFRPPEEHYFCVIASWNKRSIENTAHLGFSPWRPDLEFIRQVGLPEDYYNSHDKMFFKLDRRVLPEHAKKLLNFDAEPVLTRQRTGEKVRVHIDMPLLRESEVRNIIEKVADGLFPIPQPDP